MITKFWSAYAAVPRNNESISANERRYAMVIAAMLVSA
jgi:hypothetical protein